MQRITANLCFAMPKVPMRCEIIRAVLLRHGLICIIQPGEGSLMDLSAAFQSAACSIGSFDTMHPEDIPVLQRFFCHPKQCSVNIRVRAASENDRRLLPLEPPVRATLLRRKRQGHAGHRDLPYPHCLYFNKGLMDLGSRLPQQIQQVFDSSADLEN